MGCWGFVKIWILSSLGVFGFFSLGYIKIDAYRNWYFAMSSYQITNLMLASIVAGAVIAIIVSIIISGGSGDGSNGGDYYGGAGSPDDF